MSFILPKVPSFGENFANSLTQGLSKGVNFSSELMGKELMERMKQNRQKKLYEQLEGMGQGNAKSSDQVSDLMGDREQEPSLSQRTNNDPVQASILKSKAAALAGENALSKTYSEEAKIQEKRRAAQEEREFLPKKEYIQHAAKQNTAYLDEVGQLEKDAPNTEFSLAMVEDSLGDAGKWAAAKDFLSEKTGFKGFRSAEGTELDSAIKNYFLGDLSSIKGGRPNQFIEKQIREAYPAAGQDPISNQKILLGMRMKEKINSLKIEKTRELESKFLEKDGFLPANFRSLVNAELKKDASKIEKDTIDSLHHMSKIQGQRDKMFRSYLKKGETLMMDEDGNPFAVPNSEVSSYREQGYIPLGKK